MGDASETIRPIWRTPLATALAGWMLLVIGLAVGSGRLVEVVPGETLVILALSTVVLPVPVLLAWSFWVMLREPMTGWVAPTLLLAFCGGMVPAGGPLLDLGAQLNFLAHRPTYEAVIAEAAQADALTGSEGVVSGERNGVRYAYRADRPGEIDFTWTQNKVFTEGVRYDNTPCRPSRERMCADQGRALEGFYSHYRRGF